MGIGGGMTIESHRDLIVWQRAIDMTVAVYELTSMLPREETYGLVAQLRRAGVSVASNISQRGMVVGRLASTSSFSGWPAGQTSNYRPNS
jgi:hypothetical protein